MSDLDNKDKTNNEPNKESNLKVEFTPSNDQTDPLVVKKTPEQIKAETFTISGTPTKDEIDINANLGSFGESTETVTTVTSPVITEPGSTQAVVDNTLEKLDDKKNVLATKSKDEQIDFEKFDRRKNQKAQTALGVKLDIWLRNPKTLLKIWLVAIAVLVVIWACSITFVVENGHILKHKANYQPDVLYHAIGVAGNVLSYICIGLPIIPFIYMLTAAVVGINGIISSRTFHYVLWSILIITFILLIAATLCSGFYINQAHAFNHTPK